MPTFTFEQAIGQLEARKGGYYYFKIGAELVEQFPQQRSTRLRCRVNDEIEYSCGLNHYGDGNYFIILATKWLKKLKKERGEVVSVTIFEDPNPLGVEEPEILRVLLAQDAEAKSNYEALTDGKKRSLIYTTRGIKNVDRQVEKILEILETEALKRRKK